MSHDVAGGCVTEAGKYSPSAGSWFERGPYESVLSGSVLAAELLANERASEVDGQLEESCRSTTKSHHQSGLDIHAASSEIFLRKPVDSCVTAIIYVIRGVASMLITV